MLVHDNIHKNIHNISGDTTPDRKQILECLKTESRAEQLDILVWQETRNTKYHNVFNGHGDNPLLKADATILRSRDAPELLRKQVQCSVLLTLRFVFGDMGMSLYNLWCR